ncbi:hypothetical protein Bca52824_019235 [Brassica carinata]|uniref:Uncharacterized protein n=1 Tax=Brassica carinata TaxID=52824 RepID=A0A8X7VQD7_BRACI|nr:hypothetical protein Bca52824_019235 [Brassica carinata]
MQPLETKVNEEAKLMEKEIVLSETVDVVKDKPVSESNLTIEKEEKTVQTPAGEPEKEIPADVEEAAEVVKADESNDKGKMRMDEHTSESGTALLPEETVPINQDLDTASKRKLKETPLLLMSLRRPLLKRSKWWKNHQRMKRERNKQEESVTEKVAEAVETATVAKESDEPKPQPEVTTKEEVVKPKHSNSLMSKVKQSLVKAKKAIIEKQVVEEPSKDEKEKVSEEAKATEDENIKKDTETPAADVESVETLKETEGTKQEESVTEKVAEVVETATVAKESDEPKPQPEVTTKEEVVKPKHSNSIMSKVKQSLVKAKKAIIGKSPSSKTISTEETKEEVIAK